MGFKDLVVGAMNWHKTINDNNAEAETRIGSLERNLYNPNLLINSNFKISELINQRGVAIHTGTSYRFDTWWGSASTGGSIDLTGEYVKMVNTEGTAWNTLVNKIEEMNKYTGKQVTMSALVRSNVDGAVARIGVQGTGGTKVFYPKKNEWTLIQTTFVYSGTNYPEILTNGTEVGANTLEIAYIKLEIGETATSFVDDDNATKLSKCQRYLQVLRLNNSAMNYGYTLIQTNQIIFHIELFTQMRSTPSVTSQNLPMVYTPQNNWIRDFEVSFTQSCTHSFKVVATKNNHGITALHTPVITMNLPSDITYKTEIIISAEL